MITQETPPRGRRGRPPRVRPLGLALVASLCLLGAASASSTRATAPGPIAVAVGSLSADAANAPHLREALRAALERGIDTLPGVRRTNPRRAQWVVGGALTGVTEQSGAVRSEVSLMVTERRSGSVRYLLQGHAAARGGSDPVPASITAAVRSALRPLADPVVRPLTRR